MLIPAICYKEEIEKALGEYFYTNDMIYYTGWIKSHLIKVADECKEGNYQYAVVDNDKKLIGYIAYYVDYYSDSAYSFGAFSFDRGHPIMGKEMFNLLEKLVNTKHRVEFRAISGNPAIKGYDKFYNRHCDIGRVITLKDVFKDVDGKYHDEYIYEFVRCEK